jgi:hypothetical protein
LTLKTNRSQLIIQSVLGEISDPPANIDQPYRISADGTLLLAPRTGGITYNARIGDSAIHLWGDHIEPAVSIKRDNANANGGLNVLSCIGNRARVVTGDAKGEWGRVTGKHGGVEHVLIDFTREQMDRMTIGDKIQVISFGQGLSLIDFPGVTLLNLDPDLLNVMGVTGDKRSGRIRIPVTHTIPAAVMGSGLGKVSAYSGDYDIQMFDEQTVTDHRLNDLRFGDIVALVGADTTYGRAYRQSAVTVGVVVHSRSVVAGHGPGVTALFSSKEGLIDPVIDDRANLKYYFEALG